MAFYRLFEFFAFFYYIDIGLLILFTGIKPLLVLTYFRKIYDYVANSFVFIHPIRVPGHNLSFAETQPRIIHSSVIREYEQPVEFIYSTVESYRVWLASRVDRLKAIGNGQVPRVAAIAWELLRKRLDEY